MIDDFVRHIQHVKAAVGPGVDETPRIVAIEIDRVVKQCYRRGLFKHSVAEIKVLISRFSESYRIFSIQQITGEQDSADTVNHAFLVEAALYGAGWVKRYFAA